MLNLFSLYAKPSRELLHPKWSDRFLFSCSSGLVTAVLSLIFLQQLSSGRKPVACRSRVVDPRLKTPDTCGFWFLCFLLFFLAKFMKILSLSLSGCRSHSWSCTPSFYLFVQKTITFFQVEFLQTRFICFVLFCFGAFSSSSISYFVFGLWCLVSDSWAVPIFLALFLWALVGFKELVV